MLLTQTNFGNYGRLCNQYFQYASLYGQAKKLGIELQLPAWRYAQYFTEPFPGYTSMPALHHNAEEPHFHYSESFFDSLPKDRNINVRGYWQSEKYFEHCKDDIKKIFTFKPDFLQKVKDKIKIKDWSKKNIVLQIRRGDYLTLSHNGSLTYYQLGINFYLSALLEHFPDYADCNIILVSDDMNYCHNHFDCLPNAYFVDGFNDIEQVALMSLCHGFIISNGTFGWWGAYLAELQREVKIIHSGKLFDNSFAKENDSKDFYPARWIAHGPTKKVDLTDCTFTIPVFFDHSDRKQNLDLCVCILQKNFETNIIIGEQGSNEFKYFEKYGCKYVKFDYSEFWRTRMLNQMAKEANTPVVSNWDCDVIIAPLAIYLAVKACISGSDMCYPYDGTFVRFSRPHWFKRLEKACDIGISYINGNDAQAKSTKDSPSSGGAVMVNKEKFFEAGGENEKMISFGPEDWERKDRWIILGYKVDRINGALFHVDHFVGINSSSRNPRFQDNWNEHDKERSMSKGQLREYVNNLPWFAEYNLQPQQT